MTKTFNLLKALLEADFVSDYAMNSVRDFATMVAELLIQHDGTTVRGKYGLKLFKALLQKNYQPALDKANKLISSPNGRTFYKLKKYAQTAYKL